MSNAQSRDLKRSKKYYTHIEESVMYLKAANEQSPTIKGNRLNHLKSQIEELLTDLSDVIPSYGVSHEQLDILLDIILSPSNSNVFVNSFKTYIIQNYLISYDKISADVVMKIIASLSVEIALPEAEKSLASTVQIKLLKWVVNNFIHFELQNNNKFLVLLPVLFNYVSIGYARPYIIQLIVLLLYFRHFINPKFKLRGFLNPWRVEYLLELMKKEPNNDNLKFLAMVFKKLLKKEYDIYTNLNLNYYYRLSNMISKHSSISISYFIGSNFVANTHFDKLVEVKINYIQYKNNFSTSIEELLRDNIEINEFKKTLNDYLQLIVYLGTNYTSPGSAILLTSSTLSSSTLFASNSTNEEIKRRKIDTKQASLQHQISSVSDKSLRKAVFEDFEAFNDGNINLEQFISNIEKINLPNQIGSLIYYFAKCEESLYHHDQIFNRVKSKLGDSCKLLLDSDRLMYKNYPIYYFIAFEDQTSIEKVSNWCEVMLLKDDNKLIINYENYEELKTVFSGLLYLTRYSSVLLPFLKDIFDNNIVIVNETKSLKYLEDFKIWEIMKYYSMTNSSGFKEVTKFFTSYLDQDPNLIIKVFDSISKMFDGWRHTLTIEWTHEVAIYHCMNEVIAKLLGFFNSKFIAIHQNSNIGLKISLLRFLQLTIYKFPSKFIRITNIVLYPSLIYDFYFSNNALLIDAVCTHIMQCKKYFGDFQEMDESEWKVLTYDVHHDLYERQTRESEVEKTYNGYQQGDFDYFTAFKALHNSYILDFCNIIWRDKSFDKNIKLGNKGFFMPVSFVDTLLKQRYYHPDNDYTADSLQLMKRTYNLFHAPAFASIVTDLIRNMEDEDKTDGKQTTVRLAGPLIESEFNKLANLPEGEYWLPYSEYNSLRVSILNKLHGLGFKGIDTLLFNSLKSLSNKNLEITSIEN